ncbi:MAG TPA: DUF433 domain-containing protein [Egibacteraceae bacterium]|nr:DUF433 domain-containing protein [Egibacteraceae bacterium]
MTNEQRALIVVTPSCVTGRRPCAVPGSWSGIILDALAEGMTESEILAEYPTLTVEGIRAAAAYGAELARDEYPAVATT